MNHEPSNIYAGFVMLVTVFMNGGLSPGKITMKRPIYVPAMHIQIDRAWWILCSEALKSLLHYSRIRWEGIAPPLPCHLQWTG